MENNQKIGFSIILGAILLTLFSFLISEDVYPTYMEEKISIFDRFMNYYFIDLFKDESCHQLGTACYMVSIPTKWMIFSDICIAAYGLLLYKNIVRFPSWKK